MHSVLRIEKKFSAKALSYGFPRLDIDGVIDIDDFVRVLRGFASDTNSKLSNAVDINEDGFVNVSDIAFVKANLGKSVE